MPMNFQKIEIDSREVEQKLTGTTLRMKTIAKKMMTAANREVLKTAKKNVRSQFKTHGSSGDDPHNPPIAKSLKASNSKKENFTSFVFARSLHAAVQEKGCAIKPKNRKYLTFKINGKWIKSQGVTIPARPFLQPAISDIWDTGQAQEIMTAVLEKELKKYWDKQGA
jgi:hypothetical protein